jgi:hypothetical protein
VAGDAAAELRDLGRDLRRAGEAIRRQAGRTLDREGLPVGRRALAEGAAVLPRRGGLAALVADGRVTSTVRVGGTGATVTLTVDSSAVNVSALDDGPLRHPVFGNRAAWVSQSIEANWWTSRVKAEESRLADQLERDLADVAKRAVR